MELLVRGYVNKKSGGQESYYFENTIKNVANFIVKHEDETSEIVIENIFGKLLLKAEGVMGNLEGAKDCLPQVQEYLTKLRNKEIEDEKVEYLDFYDINNRDEFDSEDMKQKEFVNLWENNDKNYI